LADVKIYNRNNFHKHTYCVFHEAAFSEIENQKPNYKSKSGSSYYFTETGVYRLSNHWGRAANCKWRLESTRENPSRTKLGFAQWNAFHRDNDSEKLYFIVVEFDKKMVSYQHKNAADHKDAILRTASETTKIIKQIRNLFDSDSWAKHFDTDIETLTKSIIEKLITSNHSLSEIKIEIRDSL
jgi:hypothetical protein